MHMHKLDISTLTTPSQHRKKRRIMGRQTHNDPPPPQAYTLAPSDGSGLRKEPIEDVYLYGTVSTGYLTSILDKETNLKMYPIVNASNSA